jgi:hypothetical protein
VKFCKNEGLVLLADEVSDRQVADVRRQNNTKNCHASNTNAIFIVRYIKRTSMWTTRNLTLSRRL